MKVRYAFLSTVLTIALTVVVYGQYSQNDTIKTDMKTHDMSYMMGKPTVDTVDGGFHMQVWLVTQKQRKEMMEGKMGQMKMDEEKAGAMERVEIRGINDTSSKVDKDAKRMNMATTTGTYHIMLGVARTAPGTAIANASAKVLIVSPSKKSSSVTLTPMMDHLGGELTLAEKGEYRITVNFSADGVSKTTQFQYFVE